MSDLEKEQLEIQVKHLKHNLDALKYDKSRLIQQITELLAHVERLRRECLNAGGELKNKSELTDFLDNLWELSRETPTQSLQEHNRQVGHDAVMNLLDKIHEGQIKVTISDPPYRADYVDVVEWIDEQANLIKEG